MNNEITTLMNTLVQNNLAGSLDDARKMAESMIGTSNKVSKAYEENDEHFMIAGYKKSNSSVMGGKPKEEAHDHPPAFESLAEEAEELVHHEEPEPVKNGSQILTLSNHSTIKTEPKFKESKTGSLTLSNNIMVTERPKSEEVSKEAIHQIPGATEILNNNQQLDPVTSAPIEQVSTPVKNSTVAFEEPVVAPVAAPVEQAVPVVQNLVADEPKHEESLMHDVPSFDGISEEAKVESSEPKMTPEEYAAQRMNNEMSLNEVMEKTPEVAAEQVAPVVEEEKPQQLSLDNPSTIQASAPTQQNVDSMGNLTLNNPSTQAPVQENNGALSLDNPTMSQSREPEKKEGVLAAGMPDTSSITNMDLDPITSAPREPQTQKRTVSYSQPSIQGLEESGAYIQMPGQKPATQQAPVEQVAPQVAPEPVAQAPVQAPSQEVEAEKTQQIPTSSNTNEVNQYGTPKREKVELTPEEKKLRDEVDLTKIFGV